MIKGTKKPNPDRVVVAFTPERGAVIQVETKLQYLTEDVLARCRFFDHIPMPALLRIGGKEQGRERIEELHAEWQSEHRRRRDAAVECYGACDFPRGQ